MQFLQNYWPEGCCSGSGKRQEWGMDVGDVTITEKLGLICSLTRNKTGIGIRKKNESKIERSVLKYKPHASSLH